MSGFRRIRGFALRRTGFVFASVLLLGGCAGLTPAPSTQRNAAVRAYHETIEVGGRLSVRYQKDGKEEAVHASFSWTQAPQRTYVLIQSPLGQSIAEMEILPGKTTLTQAGHASRSAADVDSLTAEMLGWPLPVSGLSDWLQGFAGGSAGRRPIDTQPVTTTDGWRVEIASWHDGSAGQPSRPKRIDAARNTGAAGEVAIRIVIDTWDAR